MNFQNFINEKYTKDDINTMYGFYGAMEDNHNEKIADQIFDAAVKDLMKEFSLKDLEAVALLNSKVGRQVADAMIAGECEDNVVAGMYWYFGKNKAKIISFAKKPVQESLVTEGQYSWMTHDSNTQIGSEKENTIDVTMFDDKGNKWNEDRYKGYGLFGGKDYYELLAQMNGVENADRQDGIDLAFGKKKVKGKVLFPALVEDPSRFNFKRHDFTKEAKNDPNQSWYQEPEDEDYNESKVNETKALSLDKLTKMIGDKPSCYDLADFIYTNYNKVTGLRKSMRNDEMGFPSEIEDLVNHYKFDMDDFTDKYGMAAESLEVNETKITLKRQYTENYPAKTTGKHAAIRNKIIEALKDGELTKEEFNNLVSGLTEDSQRWLRRNAEFFNIQEDKVGLTKSGQKIASALSQVAEGGYRPMTDSERQKKQYRDNQLARLRAVDKKEEEGKRLRALQQKMRDAKLKKANENKFIYESFSEFVDSINESFELVTESFKSSMLAGLFNRQGKFDANLAKAFYGATKLKLDQIEDEDILTTSPNLAYKNKQDGAIIFYISDTEKPNIHAPEDAYISNKTIPGEGYLLAIASGDNKFYDQVWTSYHSKTRTMKKVDNDPSNSIGIGKKYKGWDATGLYNVKRISEVADRAIVINVDLLRQKYSADAQRSERAAAKKGATAFKSDKDFKAENTARYNQILAQKATQMPMDSLVAKAIDVMSEQIKDGLAKQTKGRYGDIIVGTNAKGAEAKLTDVANHMQRILDDYSRYVGLVKQEEDSISKYGEAESWYKRELLADAKNLKDRLDSVESFSYLW